MLLGLWYGSATDFLVSTVNSLDLLEAQPLHLRIRDDTDSNTSLENSTIFTRTASFASKNVSNPCHRRAAIAPRVLNDPHKTWPPILTYVTASFFHFFVYKNH